MNLFKSFIAVLVFLFSSKSFAVSVYLRCTGMNYNKNIDAWSQGPFPIKPEIVQLTKKENSDSGYVLWAGEYKTTYEDIEVHIKLFVVEKAAELFEFGVNSIQIRWNGIIVDSPGFYDPFIGEAVQAMVRNHEKGTGYKCAYMSIERP